MMSTAVEERRALALRAGDELEGATPQEILRWALGEFHPKLCIASSMGDAVLIDIASKIQPGVPVVFLDTGYHFAETIGTRDAVATVYPVELVTVLPLATVAEQDAEHGARLHERDPNLCCALRKVEPLARGLAPYDAWASGVRRDEAVTRTAIKVVDWDVKRSMVKVNPLAGWTQQQVDDYIAATGVLVNPLVNDGYPAIGCAPGPMRVAPGEDARSGRWAGTGKTECGLHV
ncbi:MAG: phosphoadenosine phosphosulfate reductase, partial [Frankiaceae bacterium]|nr:phosphoadenosine phosphosulfate reductase [Frankiaceae bacterium]